MTEITTPPSAAPAATTAIMLKPSPAQAEALRRHAGLHRIVFNHGIEVAATESFGDAIARRGGQEDLADLAIWTPEELHAAWLEWQPIGYPWAAELSPQIPLGACRAAAEAIRQHHLNNAAYPRTRTRQSARRFTYTTGCYPISSDAVFCEGIGDVPTAGPVDATLHVCGASVRQYRATWTVRFHAEAVGNVR